MLALVFCLLFQLPPVPAWPVDAELPRLQLQTVEGLGAAQGLSEHNGKLYLYGDCYDVSPRVGIIREYTLQLRPTGRAIMLARKGEPLLTHPTGLTWHPQHGCYLGDTFRGKARIYRLDWARALEDGNLDNAVLAEIDDDAAINGCRPEFAKLHGKWWLATADYGDVRPEVRLYDPAQLIAAKRSSSPGVIVHRFLAGPFNQNLHFDEAAGQLVCVQNAVVGLGWRLDRLDLAKAVADGRAWGPGVRLRCQTFPPQDELEGWRPLADGRQLFLTSSRRANLGVQLPE